MPSPIAFRASSANVAGTATTIGPFTLSGMTVGDVVISVVSYENVAAGGSGFITGTTIGGFGWSRLLYADSGSTGNAVEVVVAYWASGATLTWQLSSSQTFSARLGFYTNSRRTNDYNDQYNLPTAAVTTGSYLTDQALPGSAAFTSGHPATPQRYTYADELAVCVGAGQFQATGYGAPNVGSLRFDNARAGFGTTEVGLFDFQPSTDGLVQFSFPSSGTPTVGQHGVVSIFGISMPPRRYPMARIHSALV